MAIKDSDITPAGRIAFAKDRATIDALLNALYAADREILWELYPTSRNPDAEISALIETLHDIIDKNTELGPK